MNQLSINKSCLSLFPFTLFQLSLSCFHMEEISVFLKLPSFIVTESEWYGFTGQRQKEKDHKR